MLFLTSLLTISSRSGILTSALTRGILSTSSGKGLCLTLYLIPTSLLGIGRPSGTNTCCGKREVDRYGGVLSVKHMWKYKFYIPTTLARLDSDGLALLPFIIQWSTVWPHPLISPSSSGLVEELHGPGMSASRASDQNCHWWTGVWKDGDINLIYQFTSLQGSW